MGNALGIKAPEEPEEDDGDENYDAKAGSQFKVTYFFSTNEISEVLQSSKSLFFQEHMKAEEPQGATHFSRTKTIKQQREFLPIYAARAELTKLIRENSVVVIVGETGSGKTTQLVQYLHEERI